jgi:hypothetical protein
MVNQKHAWYDRPAQLSGFAAFCTETPAPVGDTSLFRVRQSFRRQAHLLRALSAVSLMSVIRNKAELIGI